jgi:hypothetical protein
MTSKPPFPIVCLVSAFFGAALSAFGQTPKPKGTPVDMKIDLIAWGPEIRGLYLDDAKKHKLVTAKSFTYSKPIRYSGSNLLEIQQDPTAAKISPNDPRFSGPGSKSPLGHQTDTKNSSDDPGTINKHQPSNPASPNPPTGNPTDPASGGKDLPTSSVVAHAVLPLDSKRVTILLAPEKANTFQSYVIDDDPTKLPFGRLRVHNLSSLLIALRFNGQTKAEIKPNGTIMVTPVKNHVIYELAYKIGNIWHTQENNVLAVPENLQSQMIILQNEDDYFRSSDGSKSGFLQIVTLTRTKEAAQ